MLIAILVLILIIASVMLFMRQPQFGKTPVRKELEKITHSPNFRNGKFQNLHYTPNLKEGITFFEALRKFIFNKSKRSKPSGMLPSVKTDLHNLPADKNIIVWFGHSSYFMQVDGKKFLIDPIFSGNASPLNFTTKSFAGTDVYTTDEIPVIDYLFITHDHWDHLDYRTIVPLKSKIKKIVTGLGVAAHLKSWSFDDNMVIEKDWNEEVKLDPGFIVNTTSARHFSGRRFKRDQSLWMSFVLTTPTTKIYVGGDSGYDTHFKTIGEKFGPFDLAILECGQYNEYWHYIHMMPDETVQAAIDLQAKKVMPVHWGKFSLSLHAWDEPIIRVITESRKKNVSIITPMIGEMVDLNSDVDYREWWKGIK
jgi:L-ascorbate metabolism protein UlaG (beta-lactamase superfamily)